MEDKNRSEMYQALYKALGEGVAKLIKNGLAFTVMTMCIVGLLWGIVQVDGYHGRQYLALRSEVLELKKAHSEQLNGYRLEISALRLEIHECNRAREEQSIKLARMEATLQILKR